jgi:hypothetical protein
MLLAVVVADNSFHLVLLQQVAADQVLVAMVVHLVDIMLLQVLLEQVQAVEVVLINTVEQAIQLEQMVVVV